MPGIFKRAPEFNQRHNKGRAIGSFKPAAPDVNHRLFASLLHATKTIALWWQIQDNKRN